MNLYRLEPLSLLCLLVLFSCNRNRGEEQTAAGSLPKLSRIEFQFIAPDRNSADSLKQAIISDPLYELDTVYEMEESEWMIAVKTRDSLMVNGDDEDSTINHLSEKLQVIAGRYNCELRGFAHD